MAITQVRVKVNGVWTVCTYNSSTGQYEGSLTAPAATSFHQSGGYYPVTVEAANDAGTVVIKDSTDPVLGSSLRLVVKEQIKPVISLQSPTDGAFLQNNQTPIVFTVTDEAGGSGVDVSSVALQVDGVEAVPVRENLDNGYRYTYTAQTAYQDGKHSLQITARDNDGNEAVPVGTSFTIDTVPPNLQVDSPVNNAVTNKPSCTLSGITNDATSSPVEVSIQLNGVSAGTAAVGADGRFTKPLTLVEGNNNIAVTAKDGAGRTTVISLSVKLDTTVPAIRNISLEPNPVNASASVLIRLEVS